MEDELKSEFTKSAFDFDDEKDILQRCLTFCIQYKLSASDLVSSWDGYSFTRVVNTIVDNLFELRDICYFQKIKPIKNTGLYSGRNLGNTVQSSHMGAFLEQLQKEHRNKVREKESGLHLYSNDVSMILDSNDEDMEGILDTPTNKHTLAHETPSNSAQRTNGSTYTAAKPLESVTPFGSRKSKFVVQSTLNEHSSNQTIKVEEDHANSEDDIIKRVQPSQKCSLLINQSQPEPGCRFMYDRIEDKFNFLENRIKRRATAYISSGLYEEPVDPSVASQKSIFAVGMICCEEEGRLKENPVLLQSSKGNFMVILLAFPPAERTLKQFVGNSDSVPLACLQWLTLMDTTSMRLKILAENRKDLNASNQDMHYYYNVEHSGGQRVRLDLQKLNQFSIFPGQVVGVEGHNPSGHCFIASKIIDYVTLSPTSDEHHPAKRQAMDQKLQLTNPSHDMPEVSLIVAAGPFTTSDNLLFEPLTELLAYARRKQPQLLLLLGPFIDSDRPEIRKGIVDETFDEIFQHEILAKLQDYVEYMGSSVRVILMPSIRDANHDPVFPQPAFDIHPTDFNHQIYSISNPGTFSANEVKVACCTVDILKQLSAEEICRNPQGGSKQRLTNLAKHILNQHRHVLGFSFQTLDNKEDVPLDTSLAKEALHISSVPDILILPSDLANFVKVISLGNDGEEQVKCICVNPGRLARGEGGGFFVEINYNGNADSSSASIIRI
ncbi:hypothetical protein BUALT_Bualt17G0024700 [Buddleja alternifolia]|uniref:DNA polymerase alpha subunit B n=1 Tax=Buddleja alternifolia TaxID=168488 RepID=A0AAV6WB37_9LAMI|nr:hypothetical protein BUALT_Bualt17G0024700 [Buddleja alternifolia]